MHTKHVRSGTDVMHSMQTYDVFLADHFPLLIGLSRCFSDISRLARDERKDGAHTAQPLRIGLPQRKANGKLQPWLNDSFNRFLLVRLS